MRILLTITTLAITLSAATAPGLAAGKAVSPDQWPGADVSADAPGACMGVLVAPAEALGNQTRTLRAGANATKPVLANQPVFIKPYCPELMAEPVEPGWEQRQQTKAVSAVFANN